MEFENLSLLPDFIYPVKVDKVKFNIKAKRYSYADKYLMQYLRAMGYSGVPLQRKRESIKLIHKM